MTCTIEWNTLSPAQWDECLRAVPRSTLLQTYDYARAQCPIEKQKARWGVIRFDGQPAGIVQVFEAGILWNALHAVIIDRGPLWFKGFGGAAHTKLFFEEFNKQFPPRFGRRRRILPEVEDGMTAQKILQSAGLARMDDRKGYETVWVDLTAGDESRRAALRSNWRGHLGKAERAGLTVEWDDTGRLFTPLLAGYIEDRRIRGYDGPAPQLLSSLATFVTPKGGMITGTARLPDGQTAAMVMFVTHGRSATYLVGWTTDTGRDSSAHHLLLWNGMGVLKQRGVTELDLGGVNDDSAKGIKDFKEGMGGKTVRYVGHYY